MQHLATTDTSSNQFGTIHDWDQIFKALAELEQPVDKEELAEMEKVYTECNRAAHMAFVDNHNAGYYINSYTTKLNPTMDTVMEKLFAGVRRLQEEWRDADADKQHGTSATTRRQDDFRRTMQVLSRLETSFRRRRN